jgi:hypothetical protein
MNKIKIIVFLFSILQGCTINKNVVVSKEKVKIESNNRKKTGQKLTFESKLDCSCQEIWDAYQLPEFMIRISNPKGKLKPKYKYKVPKKWLEAKTDSFNLSISFMPIGSHFIYWEKIDKDKFIIQTREKGGFVNTWDNRIELIPTSDTTCIYRDELVIHAGILTKLTAIWATEFYKFRHKNLKKYCTQHGFGKSGAFVLN